MFETRTLFFGGSFNPIHFGHLITAREVAKRANYGQVCLIPAAASPLKLEGTQLAPAEDRCQMCKLAVKDDGLFDVSGLELSRPGPSYTIDTVRELKSLGASRVDWLIGADQLREFAKWKEADALLSEAHLIVIRRPGVEIDFSKLPIEHQHLQENLVDAPLVDISATEIRRRIAAGESIDGLTSPAVIQYIKERGLYASEL